MKKLIWAPVILLLIAFMAACASDDPVIPVKELKKMPNNENLVIYNLKKDAQYAAIKDKLKGIYRPRAIEHKKLQYGNLSYEQYEKIFKETYMEQYKK